MHSTHTHTQSREITFVSHHKKTKHIHHMLSIYQPQAIRTTTMLRNLNTKKGDRNDVVIGPSRFFLSTTIQLTLGDKKERERRRQSMRHFFFLVKRQCAVLSFFFSTVTLEVEFRDCQRTCDTFSHWLRQTELCLLPWRGFHRPYHTHAHPPRGDIYNGHKRTEERGHGKHTTHIPFWGQARRHTVLCCAGVSSLFGLRQRGKGASEEIGIWCRGGADCIPKKK